MRPEFYIQKGGLKMTTATLLTEPQASTKKSLQDVACFKNVDTNQFWLVRFDSNGNIESSCHIGKGSDLKHLIFDREYNDLLDVEADKLELFPFDYHEIDLFR